MIKDLKFSHCKNNLTNYSAGKYSTIIIRILTHNPDNIPRWARVLDSNFYMDIDLSSPINSGIKILEKLLKLQTFS